MFTWHGEKALQCGSGQFYIPTYVSKLDDDADDENDNDDNVDDDVHTTQRIYITMIK